MGITIIRYYFTWFIFLRFNDNRRAAGSLRYVNRRDHVNR